MSSIHSQASDILPQGPQMAVTRQQQQQQQAPPQQQAFNGSKSPAVQKENEDKETGDMGKGANNENNNNNRTSLKSDSTKTSSPSNVANSSNGGKSVSTITFEKQKVLPTRDRTHSAQSVLSAISLQPLFHDHAHQNHQQQQNGEEQRNSSCTNLVAISQQIQSPAMSSIRRKGITSISNGRSSDEDNEIGLRLPFTDDKRLYLDSNSMKQRQKHRDLQRRGDSSKPTTLVEQDTAEEEDVIMQKKLTTEALKKLSHLRVNSTMCVGINKIISSNNNNNNNSNNNNNNSNNNNNNNSNNNNNNSNNNNNNNNNLSCDDDGGTIDENSHGLQTMTHLKFGDKKVFLDPFPQGSGNGNNKGGSLLLQEQELPASTGKRSLDVIQQPGRQPPRQSTGQSNTQQNVGMTPTSGTRKYVKQISNPKKPLYLPAVLRDVSETNLTNDDFVRASSPEQSLASNAQTVTSHYVQQQYHHLNQNTGGSSIASIHSSSGSSVMETCRQAARWFFPSNEYSPRYRWNSLLDKPAPPTKQHWLSDDKRTSCHYCHKLFTFWERKHHCRHCGDIFCQQHLGHWLYLNSDASFIIGGGGLGTLSKICDGCLEEYENVVRTPKWKDQRLDNENREAFGQLMQATGATTTATTLPRTLGGVDVQNNDSKEGFIGSFAGSVPADWNWSSF